MNINNSYEAFINKRRTSSYFRESLYDCTVKYWRISEKKAAMATHIIGCYKGKVVEVVKINSFNTIKSEEYFGRKVFEGIEDLKSATYWVLWDFACKTTKIHFIVHIPCITETS